MKRIIRLNTALLSALGRVLGMTNAELMEAAGISNATWYRIIGHPEEITVQQLISIANGLCVPVRRFFSYDGIDMVGSKDNYVADPYKPCYYDGDAMLHLINTSSVATWMDVASVLGMTRTNLRHSLLLDTRLPVSRFLSTCEYLDIDPFLVIVDTNTLGETNRQMSNTAGPRISSQDGNPLPENFIERHLEIAKLRQELFDTKYELDILRRNQKSDSNITKRLILSPVTWFYGIHFTIELNDMSAPVLDWFQMLVKKEHPHYAYFFAKTGSEYNSVRFYTEEGIIFFEAGCESDLANYLFRERIMVGKIQANILEDTPNAIEFKADLVANTREDREDTADFAKFRREMIQKFG